VSGGTRLIANLRVLALLDVALERRSLPSTGVTRFPRYYEPLRHPKRPSLSLTGVRLAPKGHRWGFPCCERSPVRTCRRQYPGGRRERFFARWLFPSRRPSPSLRRVGSSLSFSGPAQRSRVLRPARSRSPRGALSIEGFGAFVTSRAASITTGRSESCRVGLSPTEDRRLCTAHAM